MADGFWYVATPYSKYEEGFNVAAFEAAKAGAILVNFGFCVYCPIVHIHQLIIYSAGALGHLDDDLWREQDQPFMEGAKGLIVVMMNGWKESDGIKHEIEVFEKVGKPILYMGWPLDNGSLKMKSWKWMFTSLPEST
jgi:hypothetical protein